MATTDDRDMATFVDHARYCAKCGHLAGDGPFCPGCGSVVDAPQTPPAPQPLPPPSERQPRSKAVLIGAAGALGLVLIAVAAIIILTGSSGSSNSNQSSSSVTVYRQKLTAALAPVIAANNNLSSALQSLDGSTASITSAGNAASQASSAVVAAQGAVNVLTVPSADQTLSQQLQQALTQENGYLGAVNSALRSPAGGSVSQLRTLVTNAQSALVPIEVVAAGAGTSLTGTDNLIGWASGAAAAAARAAHKQAQPSVASSAGSSGGSSSSGGGSTAAPVQSGTNCGGGIFAGPNTSCPFAQNVHDAWLAAPGDTNTLQVYSPVTNQTYTMNCAPAGSGITCSGGNNASVSW
jgi:hypothetical protein